MFKLGRVMHVDAVLTVNSRCRVFLYSPDVEGADIYIEGIVEDIDDIKGIYVIKCTKDNTVSNKTIRKHLGISHLSREGQTLFVPISPEYGDFIGRVKQI